MIVPKLTSNPLNWNFTYNLGFYGHETERAQRLYRNACRFDGGVFVDMGVRDGVSSNALVSAARLTGGHVYGIDWTQVNEKNVPLDDERYTFLKAESVDTGKNWSYSNPDLVFVDTCHVESYTLCELYYWWDLLNVGGLMAFHDTAWPEGKHDHACGKDWPRVEDALFKFFNINSLDYEDEHISSGHFPNDKGMTCISKKDDFDFKSNIDNWEGYFDDRKMLMEEIEKEGSRIYG